MRARRLLPLALAALIAGCGGGGGGGQLTAAELRQKADAICADYTQRVEALGQPESLEDLPEFIDQAIPILEQGLDELGELEPPDELEANWERAMTLNEQTLGLTRDLRDAAEEGDDERVQQLIVQLDEAEAEVDGLAREMGLEECGED